MSPPSTHAEARLQALAPLTEDLAKSLMCPICLDFMYKARQLQCGHLFCADCVVRILRMRNVRCAMCKQKTGKRMVRVAPLPFDDLVRALRILQNVAAFASANRSASPRKDHAFRSGVGTAIARMRNEREERARLQREAESRPSANGVVSSAHLANGNDGQVRESQTGALVDVSYCCILCTSKDAPDSKTNEEKLGKIMKVVHEIGDKQLWAHERCALFSEDVYEIDGMLENMRGALGRGAVTKCHLTGCGEMNATVKCANPSCDKRYHFACAIQDECVVIEDGYRVFCKNHGEDAPTIDDADFEMALSGARESATLLHEDVCYVCQSGGRLLMCDGCVRVTHVACSGLRGIPIGEWKCGVCTGAHSPSTPSAKRVRVERASGLDSITRSLGSAGSNSGKRARRASDARRFVLSYTGLDETQKEVLLGLAKARRTAVKDYVDDKVTHLVIGCHGRTEKVTRTMKLCQAIARKLPVVCYSWVEASSQLTHSWETVGEEFIHACCRRGDQSDVFANRAFSFSCFIGDKNKREELVELVKSGGGFVMQRDGWAKDGGDVIFVRNEDGVKRRARDGKSRFEPPVGATVVSHTWLLDEITPR